MTDLTERLRSSHTCPDGGCPLHEAAAELEQLRVELNNMACDLAYAIGMISAIGDVPAHLEARLERWRNQLLAAPATDDDA